MRNLLNRLAKHPLARNSAIVFAGSTVLNITSYLYHLIVGRILGPSQYGELTAILSIFFIISIPSQVLQTVLIRYFSIFYARHDDASAKQLYITITKKIVFWCLLGFIITIPFIQFVSTYLRLGSVWYFLWLYGIFLFFILSIINGSILQGYQRFFESSLYNNIAMAFRIAFAVPAAFFGVGWTLVANVLSSLVGYLVSVLPLKFLLRAKSAPLTLSKSAVALYGIPALLATLGVSGIYNFDILLVKHYFSPYDAGLYAAVSVLGKIIFFASGAIGLVLFPTVVHRKELKQKYIPLVILGLLGTVCISGILTVIYFVAPRFVIHLLFGVNYEGAVPLIGWYGLFICAVALDNMLLGMYLALGSVRFWMLTIAALVGQIVFISIHHETLLGVIQANVIIAIGLFIGLLLYYPYARRNI